MLIRVVEKRIEDDDEYEYDGEDDDVYTDDIIADCVLIFVIKGCNDFYSMLEFSDFRIPPSDFLLIFPPFFFPDFGQIKICNDFFKAIVGAAAADTAAGM